jgi:hypothetical protein
VSPLFVRGQCDRSGRAPALPESRGPLDGFIEKAGLLNGSETAALAFVRQDAAPKSIKIRIWWSTGYPVDFWQSGMPSANGEAS